MCRSKIYFFSGEVHSGKTSRLSEWVKVLPRVDGILAPVINGKRFLRHIRSGEIRQLDATPLHAEQDIVKVGNYAFSISAFRWAGEILFQCRKENLKWLIIDEIGPLEIRGQGLDATISKILTDHSHKIENIVLVVRKGLINVVQKHYRLQEEQIQFIDIKDKKIRFVKKDRAI